MLSNRDYDLISGYLDDELTDSERSEVESRLPSDAEFAAELSAIRRTINLVKTLPELTAPRDFRLTREQAASIVRERPARALAPNRTLMFRRTLIPLMSAVASVVLVLVGFVSLWGGQLTSNQPNADTAAIALLQTNTAPPLDADSQTNTFGLMSPVNPPTMTSDSPGYTFESLPATDTFEYGSGGGAADVIPPTGGMGGEAADMMMMSVPEASPSPELNSAGAARSSLPPAPTQTMLMTATAEMSESATMALMVDGTPVATDVQSFDAYDEAESTNPADQTMVMQAPAPVTASTDDEAASNQATDPLADTMLATEATRKLGDDGAAPQGGISPFGGLLLVISGVGLGVVTMILRLRKPL